MLFLKEDAMLVTLREIVDRANAERYAVPAPNVSTELDARAALEVAEELNTPMVLDVGFRVNPDIVFFGSYLTRLADKAKVPVAVHLDHGASYKEFEQCVLAIRAGFTSIMVDRSTLPFEENIAQVRELTRIAHAVGVSVEAELGHVGSGKTYDTASAAYTDPALALEFVKATGIDCLAVAIGNAHGSYQGVPKIDFDRLVAIKEATGGFPLVLHGSSGIAEKDLEKTCRLGINKVNVSQELLRGASREILGADLAGNGVYKLWALARKGYKDVLAHLITNCYGSRGKAWNPEREGLGEVAIMVMGEQSSPLYV